MLLNIYFFWLNIVIYEKICYIMNMHERNYFETRNLITVEKTRELRKKLPFICNEFFIGIEPNTTELSRLGYAQDLLIFFDFLKTQINEFIDINIKYFDYGTLEKVSTTHIEMFLDYLTYYTYNGKELSNTKKTKSRKLASIKAFFKYNYNKNNLPNDPASKIRTPKCEQKPILRLETNEVAELISTAESGNELEGRQVAFNKHTNKRDVAILSLFLGTGIRISELVGLDIMDIDFRVNGFRITRKGGNQTILYFSDEVAVALYDYLDERSLNEKVDNEPALFVSLQNKRICVRSVENLVKKYAHIISPLKNITPHKLRSTYGTALYQQTNDIYVVAEVLGHRDINTTKKHYAAISEEIKRNAANKVWLRKDKD